MPGSMLNAWPTSSGSELPSHDVGILVGLQADAVTGSVDEVLAVPGLGDDSAGGAVDLLARCSHHGRRDRRLLRLEEHRVGVGHVGRDVARVHATGGVRAVSVHRAAEVAQHDLVLPNHPRAGMMMRARGVLTRSHDREVHDLVTFGDDPRGQIGRHLGLGAADERNRARTAARRRCGRRRRRAAASASSSAWSFIMRSGPTTSTARRYVALGICGKQLDQESGPHLVTDRNRPSAPDAIVATSAVGSSVSPHGNSSNTPGCRLDSRCLQTGNHHRGITVGGHDQHRQALERHRVIAGQVRQVVADRQQQRVDTLFRHRGTHAVESVEIDLAHAASQSSPARKIMPVQWADRQALNRAPSRRR